MTVTAEVWLKIHAKLSVFVGLLPWYTAIFICLHFFNSFIYVKMTLLCNFNGFGNEFLLNLRTYYSGVQCVQIRISQLLS